MGNIQMKNLEAESTTFTPSSLIQYTCSFPQAVQGKEGCTSLPKATETPSGNSRKVKVPAIPAAEAVPIHQHTALQPSGHVLLQLGFLFCSDHFAQLRR